MAIFHEPEYWSKRRAKNPRQNRQGPQDWLDKMAQRQLNDPYVKQAKAEGYRSRAAYKLLELDDDTDFSKGRVASSISGSRRADGPRLSDVKPRRQQWSGSTCCQQIRSTARSSRWISWTKTRLPARQSAWRAGRSGAVRHGGQYRRPSPD